VASKRTFTSKNHRRLKHGKVRTKNVNKVMAPPFWGILQHLLNFDEKLVWDISN
jgi:hypothetical protein